MEGYQFFNYCPKGGGLCGWQKTTKQMEGARKGFCHKWKVLHIAKILWRIVCTSSHKWCLPCHLFERLVNTIKGMCYELGTICVWYNARVDEKK